MVKNFLRLQKAPKVPKKPKIIFLLASNPQMQPWPTWAYFMSYSLILKPVPTILLCKKCSFVFFG